MPLVVPCVVVSVDVWLPVVALVLLLSDWFPVVVVLSMLSDERPRRSMFGLTVEVEPVMLLDEFAVDPVTDEVVPDVEPVLDEVDGVLDAALDGLVPIEDDVEPVVASGAQSSCTGLAECSFAAPVDFFASLPAFGWACPEFPASRLLHGGKLEPVVLAVVLEGFVVEEALPIDDVPLVLPLIVPLRVPLVLPLRVLLMSLLPLVEPVAEGWDFDAVELVVCANAGAAIMAATASALMNWERIMSSSS